MAPRDGWKDYRLLKRWDKDEQGGFRRWMCHPCVYGGLLWSAVVFARCTQECSAYLFSVVSGT